MGSVDRRTFLLLAGSGAAAAGAAALTFYRRGGNEPLNVPGEEPAPLVPDGAERVIEGAVLPKQFEQTLASVCDTIVPSDADSAGAQTVGAFDYLIEQLRRRDMQGVRRVVMRGASVVNKLAVRSEKGLFQELDEGKRETVLTSMLQGAGGNTAFDSKEFIQMMVALTLEGLFSHPSYGGNQGGEGWQLIGYDGACVARTLGDTK